MSSRTGLPLYQHGFLDQAAESFQQVIAAKPDNANAYYNLGTLNLRRNRPDEAKLYSGEDGGVAADLRRSLEQPGNAGSSGGKRERGRQ